MLDKMNFKDKLLAIISGIEKTFHVDELAYLAVTSKVENPLRDRIAFSLYSQMGKDLLVNREWRAQNSKSRADIAITDFKNTVKYMIEFKAHSAPSYEKGYSELIRADLKKMYNTANDSTELYFVLFFNHIQSIRTIDRKFENSIKYYGLINKALEHQEFKLDMSTYIKRHWERHLEDIGLPLTMSSVTIISAGRYHDMPVFIHSYVIGPFFRNELARIR
ncbi:MAG TPA: hypothetical protein VG738_17625 [Chitinophagaceae bacterium]|nr:hypothetical protein [Chitinophagaceae bacterium]